MLRLTVAVANRAPSRYIVSTLGVIVSTPFVAPLAPVYAITTWCQRDEVGRTENPAPDTDSVLPDATHA